MGGEKGHLTYFTLFSKLCALSPSLTFFGAYCFSYFTEEKAPTYVS